MYRSLMASTAIIAFAPALSAAPISTPVTAPVKTSTANNGAPGEVSITKDGSITITGGGTAVTMDTNHAVSNAGNITVNNANGAHDRFPGQVEVVAVEPVSGPAPGSPLPSTTLTKISSMPCSPYWACSAARSPCAITRP